ncbi:TPA: hypothetical protein R1S54_000094 [Klebsiella pneumoniae]|nr:hypothetical protein [Klebsiella quasipneumoniae subsp. quasipneumoniae]HEC0929918.1 hypothetical protein [Klebsiella pneumoniae]
MTDITELAQREKFEAWWERTQHNGNPPRFGWEYWREGEGYKVDDDDSELDGMWEVWKAASAELVDALESEKRICATWRKTAEANSEKLEKAQAINAAAEKLVRCKGRYHSEQNYRALAALFGVTTPDLPLLDSESSAVTVKLTDINEYLAEVHDKTLNRAFRLLAQGVRAGDVAAMRAAGIKVEAE